MKKFLTIDIQTRMSDYDVLGHINNVSYVNFLEVARLEGFSNHLNLDLRRYSALTVKTEIEYVRPAPYGVPLAVNMSMESVGKRRSTVGFEVVDRQDHSTVFARASISQVAFDIKTGRPCTLPEHVQAGMLKLLPADKSEAA